MGDDDYLLIVEHPNVYTCGRRHFKDINQYINQSYYDAQNDDGHALNLFKGDIHKIDRGGNVTFHGDGQLVVYPIFNLRKSHFPKQCDLHWYLRTLEDVIIDLLLKDYLLKTNHNFDCYHDEDYTGVWVKNDEDIQFKDRQYKICAIGIGCSRYKTFHGLAFNIKTDLNHFNKIVPCGIFESSKSVINLSDIIDCGDATDRLTKENGEFDAFTSDMINRLIVLFEQHFNID